MKTISKDFWEDQQWGVENHTDLLKRFKDQWVAISDKHVVCSGLQLEKVEEEARKITKKSENPVMFVECGAHIY